MAAALTTSPAAAVAAGPFYAALSALWPSHAEQVIARAAASADLDPARDTVARFMANVGSPDALVADYRWTCEQLREEELYFHRNFDYRLAGHPDEVRAYYADSAYMERYLNGLLASHLFWWNHTATVEWFRKAYLPLLQPGTRHLEIGPGHGLFLKMAGDAKNVATMEAWDLAPAALDRLGKALGASARKCVVTQRDATQPALPADSGRFDSVVLSEILEHVDEPGQVLQTVREILAPGGHIFVNVPANSPAPDHVYLLSHPDESVALVAGAGFRVIEKDAFPMNGYSLARALRQKATISCVMVAVKG